LKTDWSGDHNTRLILILDFGNTKIRDYRLAILQLNNISEQKDDCIDQNIVRFQIKMDNGTVMQIGHSLCNPKEQSVDLFDFENRLFLPDQSIEGVFAIFCA
jgi:hypothetical protein